MKKAIFPILLIVALFAFSFKLEKDTSLARVHKTKGKLVFLDCEPVHEYDVVFEFKFKVYTGSFEEYRTRGIDAADKYAAKESLNYDAIIVGNTKKDIAIKFK